MRILIVDDEPLARLNLSSLLIDESDFEVVGECGDARAAASALAETRPQLLFLDVQMPGMSGYALAVELRKRFSPAQLPLLVLTSVGEGGQQFAALGHERLGQFISGRSSAGAGA